MGDRVAVRRLRQPPGKRLCGIVAAQPADDEFRRQKVFFDEVAEAFGDALLHSKDPSIYTVIAEDSAAVLGVGTAAVGLWASHALNRPALDGVASIVIGLLLCAVASVLIFQSRQLLVGAAVSDDTAGEIRRIASDEGPVVRAAWPLTMYLGPEEVLLAIDVEFDPKLPAEAVQASVVRLEGRIRARFPRVKRIYIEARRVADVPAEQSIDHSSAQAQGDAEPSARAA